MHPRQHLSDAIRMQYMQALQRHILLGSSPQGGAPVIFKLTHTDTRLPIENNTMIPCTIQLQLLEPGLGWASGAASIW